MPKHALRAQPVDIAGLPLRQDVLAKDALMPAQRDFGSGISPLTPEHRHLIVTFVSLQTDQAQTRRGRASLTPASVPAVEAQTSTLAHFTHFRHFAFMKVK
jgi:hypothetical protein